MAQRKPADYGGGLMAGRRIAGLIEVGQKGTDMEKNMNTQSDHSVLDAPRIRTVALDAGYSSVNLYDEVDSTTTRARRATHGRHRLRTRAAR